MNIKKLLVKLTWIGLTLFPLFILTPTIAANAAGVTLRWDSNDSIPEGYRVFARRSDQFYDYTRPDWEGPEATCTLDNLEAQTDYYFVVRAYDGDLESLDSDEVHCITASISIDLDTTAPSWSGATTGAGLAKDNATGGSANVEFDGAHDAVDGSNLKFNVYYAPSTSWNNADWADNNQVADASVVSGSTFDHAVTVGGLTNGVNYTFGVRVEDQAGNEDTNTTTVTATPTLRQAAGAYNLMLSDNADRSGAVYLDGNSVQGNIYVFAEPASKIKRVVFYIDDQYQKGENYAPYDLAGTLGSGLARPYDSHALKNGSHAFRALIIKTDGSRETITATTFVEN